MSEQYKEKAIVIKFGGSGVIDSYGVKSEYICSFLRYLSPTILSTFAHAFFVIGGGKRVREQQSSVTTQEDKDTIGIKVTQEHAEQLRVLIAEFGIPISSVIPTSLEMARQIANNGDFALALGGLRIGQTTDAVAVTAAEILQEQQYQAEIVILSNVLSIFTDDPNRNPQARAIKRASIDHLIKLGILSDNPADFRSGMNVTIDPVAVSRLNGNNHNISVYFGHGEDFLSIKQYLIGEIPQNGTIINSNQDDIEFY